MLIANANPKMLARGTTSHHWIGFGGSLLRIISQFSNHSPARQMTVPITGPRPNPGTTRTGVSLSVRSPPVSWFATKILAAALR